MKQFVFLFHLGLFTSPHWQNFSLDVKKDIYNIIIVIIVEDVKQQCRNMKSLW